VSVCRSLINVVKYV